jgi:hypothetical protein
MKTNALLIAALILLGAGVNAVAKEDPTNVGFAVIPVKGSDVFKVVYKNENSNRVKLNLYNEGGQLVFSESITSEGFIRPLNFSSLTPGEYTIEVIDGDSKQTEKISHRVAGSEIAAASDKIVHVARVVGSEEKIILSIANASSENFVINIFNENDDLVHSETAKVNGSEARLYSVKNGKVSRVEVTDNAGVKSVKNF